MTDSERLDWIRNQIETVARYAGENALMTLAVDYDGEGMNEPDRKKAWRKAIDEAAQL